MKRGNIQLTTAQFAKLHNINKRTLHYYDTIKLFSPNKKSENGYRYYDISQCIDFEYIRMLKELNMSIEEIKEYLENPNSEKFIKIADVKLNELDKQINMLKRTKKILQMKKEQIDFCKTMHKQVIKIVECKEQKLYVLPYEFIDDDISEVFSVLKDKWNIEQIRMGIGSYISIENVLKRNFEKYGGLYTPALLNFSHLDSIQRPKGKYLCGYQKGSWKELPLLYKEMISYAEIHQLNLIGYAYEIGLNEFAITNQNDYVTQIMIKIEE